MNKNEPILRSLATIEANLLEKLTVEALAGDIHFSKHYYQRMFREIVGDSVMHYVARRKISLAAKELVTTNATILEIALKYGQKKLPCLPEKANWNNRLPPFILTFGILSLTELRQSPKTYRESLSASATYPTALMKYPIVFSL